MNIRYPIYEGVYRILTLVYLAKLQCIYRVLISINSIYIAFYIINSKINHSFISWKSW